MAKSIYCSFCGRSNDIAGKMVESSDRADPRNIIRICLDCAKMAVGILERMNAETVINDDSEETLADPRLKRKELELELAKLNRKFSDVHLEEMSLEQIAQLQRAVADVAKLAQEIQEGEKHD